VLSQLAQTCQRAALFRHQGERFLYLRTYRSAHYLVPREQLFNLDRDPHETHDLAPANPELVREARTLLDAWQQAALDRGTPADPLMTVLAERPHQDLKWYTGRLRATGREALIPRVTARAGEDTAVFQELRAGQADARIA
jgi:hypothetical protein